MYVTNAIKYLKSIFDSSCETTLFFSSGNKKTFGKVLDIEMINIGRDNFVRIKISCCSFFDFRLSNLSEVEHRNEESNFKITEEQIEKLQKVYLSNKENA